MADLEQFKQIYFDECAELLANVEDGLLTLDPDNVESDTINAIFRAVHSIKGGGGAFGFNVLVNFAHQFEAVLNDVRQEKIDLTRELVDVMIRANDVLGGLIVAAKEDAAPDEAEADEMLRAIKAAAYGTTTDEAELEGPAAAGDTQALLDAAFADEDAGKDASADDPLSVFDEDDSAGSSADGPSGSSESAKVWKIDFRPKPNMVQFGNEPLHLIRSLEDLGKTVVRCDIGDVPPLMELNPELIFFRWEIFLEGDVEQAAVLDVFEFAVDEADIVISPADPEDYAFARGWDVDYEGDESDFIKSFHDAGSDDFGTASVEPHQLADDAEDDGGPLAEAADSVAAASETPPKPEPVSKPAPTPAPAGPTVPAPAEKKAPTPPPKEKKAGAAGGGRAGLGGQTIRVDLEKIDRLVNLVGEMVITQAMISEQTKEQEFGGSGSLVEGLEELAQHTRELQDSVMAIRAQPVSSVFSRMPRLVREVAGEVGKDVQLIVTGEATEVDKTVVELLADPLVHMIRNSIDHGLESTQDRIAVGKSPTGIVRLSAEHRSGRILIQIADDGRGINREKVLEKAREKGLVAPDAVPSDEEIDNMIFMPGFSTADSVSAISGRGVGMDVVGRNMQALGGRIVVTSTPGEGSTFTLSLPLTLAVLDGMVVRIAGQRFVVPLTNIVESLRPTSGLLSRMVDDSVSVRVRGDYVRVVPIWRLFGLEGAVEDVEKGLVVIAETEEGGRIGLQVDDIVGQQQVVIKSLEANFRHLPGVSAATILGDGRVALILDVAGLREYHRYNKQIPMAQTALLAGE